MHPRIVALGRAAREELNAIDAAFGPLDVLVTAACFFAVVGVADWMTRYEWSLYPFYLVLVMLVTWRCGWKWGVAFAAAALLNQVAIGLVSGYPFSKVGYFAAANLERLFSSLVVVGLVSRLRSRR